MSRKIAPMKNHGTNRYVVVECQWCSAHFKASTRRSPRPRFCSYRCGSLRAWNDKAVTHLEALLSKAKLDDNGCLIWHGTMSRSGYGIAFVKGVRMLAHRAVWEVSGQTLSPGKELCHQCSNKRCVNPNHIYQGTHAENMADHARSGRARNQNTGKSHCPKGHPYDAANTRVVVGRRGKPGRQCKACAVERVRKLRALARLDKASATPRGDR